jgi:DNA invertase Pin-like site-specific DNA recombinase
MTGVRSRPWGVSENKITAGHRDRLAVVYVRQSTRRQVLVNQESTRLQYGLVERAVALGWARSRVTVIDEDLGMSAAVSDTRAGFARLVTEVTMGRVGIVVGIEMSRLARSGRDWHQLLELCSLSGTLLADPDGVYDPTYYNDRLLLGLKGTMSEAELFLIKQRMATGRLAKAERGELAFHLPIGYVRRGDGQVVFDPDEQAQHVVRLVFEMFTQLGTLNAVLRYLVTHNIQLPVRNRTGPDRGELSWRRPSRATLQIMLHNPIYAGYYAWGRRQTRASRKIPGRPATGRVTCGQEEWLVLLPDRMPAYISVEQYEANLARLAANRNTATSVGAAQAGSALLSGLLRCGRCGGHRMTVQYHAPAHSYVCGYENTNHGTGHVCQHIAGPALDAYVTAQMLSALAPAALEVSARAVDQAEAERANLDTLWRQRLERAEHAADRARRQYQLTEPENRLVARTLETDWEAALADLDRLRREYDRFTTTRPRILTAAERAAIIAAATDLPGLWNAPTTTQTDRKDLLRLLIQDITVAVVGISERVDVTICWAGGHTTTGQATRPVARLDQLSYYPDLIARVTELAAAGHSSRVIAEQLNTDGFRPPKRTDRFGPGQVRHLANQQGIRLQAHRRPPVTLTSLGPHQWSVTGLAAHLNIPTPTIYNWIHRGWITARRAPDDLHWIITADPAELTRLRELRDHPPGYHTRRRWTNPDPAPGDTP